MWWLGAAALAACFLVPAFFAFRWRRAEFTPEELVLDTRWRGGLRRSRRFAWTEVARLGAVDWDDLGPALAVETRAGRRFLLPLGALDADFEPALEGLAAESAAPEAARQMLRQALAERRAYRDERRPIAAGSVPPAQVWKGLVENGPDRLRLVLPAGGVPGRALKVLVAPAAGALACVLGLVFGGPASAWLVWAGAGLGALAVAGLVLVLLSREEVDAFSEGLSVGRGLFGARRRELSGRPEEIRIVTVGGRTVVQVLSEDDEALFGAALSGGALNWVQARLASVWGLQWRPIEEGSKFGDYVRPGTASSDADRLSPGSAAS
jgi:hypothetical protein